MLDVAETKIYLFFIVEESMIRLGILIIWVGCIVADRHRCRHELIVYFSYAHRWLYVCFHNLLYI